MDRITPKRLVHLTLTMSVFALVVLLAGPAWAQLTNYKTAVTFHAPVEVSGSNPQILPAGTYIFKVVDSKVNRNIVQISNEREDHIYTTILAIPTRREQESDKTVMTFEERAAGQPQALRAWFYPHEKNGQEFVFSKSDATRLARLSNSPVPYSDSAANVQVASSAPGSGSRPAAQAQPPAPIFSILPNGETAQSTTLQAQVNSQPAPIRNATIEQTPVRSTTEQSTVTRAGNSQAESTQNPELPRTGGLLPLFVLAGCFSVIAGLSLRVLCGR